MWTTRLGELSTLGFTSRLTKAVLYSARYSVFPHPQSTLELTTAQAFILALFRSFLLGDASAVFSLLPLVPLLPQLQSSSVAVWLREDFSFKRQDVTKALSWLAHFVKKEGPVVPANVLLVFKSLDEKYKVLNYFKEVGDTISEEMFTSQNPLVSEVARPKEMKDQSVQVRPKMVSTGTQTYKENGSRLSNVTGQIMMASVPSSETMKFSQNEDVATRFKPQAASDLKDLPVVYATCQSIESIPTETILEELENSDEAPTRTRTPQPYDELLTFLVLPDRTRPSAPPFHRPLYLGNHIAGESLPPEEPIYANIPTIMVTSPAKQRSKTSERPRSLQMNEIFSSVGAQRNDTITRTRPSSYIENLTQDRRHETTSRAYPISSLEYSKNTSTLKSNSSSGKSEATKKLMKAAERGNISAAVAAIAEGANVDQRDSVRRTPLHLAVVGGHQELVQRLIDAGADKDKKDSMGRTPLHYTALRGRIDCAQLLLSSGADPNVRDSSGLTPTALATMKHNSGVATILKKKGGQDCSIS